MKILVHFDLRTEGKKCDDCQFMSNVTSSIGEKSRYCVLFQIDINNDKRCSDCIDAENSFDLLKIKGITKHY